MSKGWIAAGIAGLVFLIGWRVSLDYAARQDDSGLIRAAVKEAIDGSADGRPGSALDLLSQNLRMNNESMPVDRQTVANFIRDQKPTVEITRIKPSVSGDFGRITSPVNLGLGPLGSRTLSEVTMIFVKEDDRLYGIIPVKKWRMTEIQVPQESWTSLMGQ